MKLCYIPAVYGQYGDWAVETRPVSPSPLCETPCRHRLQSAPGDSSKCPPKSAAAAAAIKALRGAGLRGAAQLAAARSEGAVVTSLGPACQETAGSATIAHHCPLTASLSRFLRGSRLIYLRSEKYRIICEGRVYTRTYSGYPLVQAAEEGLMSHD